MDDILFCSPYFEISKTDTSSLLNFLSKIDYGVSTSKAQLSTTQIIYLGLTITQTQKAITVDRKKKLIQSHTGPFNLEEV